jgi:hypothetical protein
MITDDLLQEPRVLRNTYVGVGPCWLVGLYTQMQHVSFTCIQLRRCGTESDLPVVSCCDFQTVCSKYGTTNVKFSTQLH